MSVRTTTYPRRDWACYVGIEDHGCTYTKRPDGSGTTPGYVKPFEEDRAAGAIASFLGSTLVSNHTSFGLSGQGHRNSSADTMN